jgi:hypothetical protein
LTTTVAPRREEAGIATTSPRCYGLRRVNPCLGVVMVVQTDDGRALSADGRHWQLEVAAHPPRGLWSAGGHGDERQWFRVGRWSAGAGLTGMRLNPILDMGLMVSTTEALAAAVAAAEPRLPFALAPELELWQLGRDGRPLALLATAPDDGSPADDGDPPAWAAGGRGEPVFRSSILAAEGVPEPDQGDPARHARALERAVAGHAGGPGAVLRVRRDAAGERVVTGDPGGAAAAGFGAGPGGAAGPSRQPPAAAFPPLMLREDWGDARLDTLAQEYLAWCAPYLLTLPDLDDARRAALEQAAARRAPLVDQLWRLYPRLADPEVVRRARVEAKLRMAGA